MKAKKFTFIYSFFALFLVGTMFLSFSSKPPIGKTGAPDDGMCTDCHNPSNPLGLNGEFMMTGFPSEINPGETYSISVVVRNDNGLAQRNGFQAVVLDSENNNIGDLTTTGTNPTTETDANNGREYVGHNPSMNFDNNEVNWTFDWTAPEDNIGEVVTMYVASVVGSGTAGNGEDLMLEENFSATIQSVSTTNDLNGTANIDIFPNPASEFFTLKMDGPLSELVNIRLMSATGQLVYAATDLSLNSVTEVPVADLSRGIYFLQINGATASATRRIVVAK